MIYSKTPLFRINGDGVLSGYADNKNNYIFLLKRLHW